MTPDDAGGRGDPDASGVNDSRTEDGGDGDGTEGDADSGCPGDDPTTVSPESTTEPEDSDGLGWHGWVLVGGLIIAMVLVPWAVVFLPRMQGFLGSLGLGVRDAYLVLPMVPALGLGLLAVWAAIAYRRRE